LIKLLVLGLITGTLIGTIGIGGILLSPLLTYFLGIDLHLAMAISSWSFLFTGIVGTITYAVKRTISWYMVCWLSLGIIPAAILGAWTNSALPTALLTIILASLIIFSGLNALYKQPLTENDNFALSKIQLILIGLGVGFGSSLTGTGGPVLLVPILIFLDIPALAAIGVSQVIQLPVAIFASIGFGLYGKIDFELGTTIGIIQAIGVVFGAWIAHSIPSKQLHKIVAFTIIAVGLFLIEQTLF
jgi:uncharacterized protein